MTITKDFENKHDFRVVDDTRSIPQAEERRVAELNTDARVSIWKSTTPGQEHSPYRVHVVSSMRGGPAMLLGATTADEAEILAKRYAERLKTAPPEWGDPVVVSRV